MGHIDLGETQMATSKNAAKAATKAKATAEAVTKAKATKKAVPSKATKTQTPAKKATSSASASAPSKKVKVEPGYKGHLKGSKKGDMHKFFDSMKSPDAVKFLAKCESAGLKKSTAQSWFGTFKKSA